MDYFPSTKPIPLIFRFATSEMEFISEGQAVFQWRKWKLNSWATTAGQTRQLTIQQIENLLPSRRATVKYRTLFSATFSIFLSWGLSKRQTLCFFNNKFWISFCQSPISCQSPICNNTNNSWKVKLSFVSPIGKRMLVVSKRRWILCVLMKNCLWHCRRIRKSRFSFPTSIMKICV